MRAGKYKYLDPHRFSDVLNLSAGSKLRRRPRGLEAEGRCKDVILVLGPPRFCSRCESQADVAVKRAKQQAERISGSGAPRTAFMSAPAGHDPIGTGDGAHVRNSATLPSNGHPPSLLLLPVVSGRCARGLGGCSSRL